MLKALPNQPHLFVDESTWSMHVLAESYKGAPILLVGNDAAWRDYWVQWAYYQNFLYHSGPVASDPDVGWRQHMRGGSEDIADKRDIVYMKRAGFVFDVASEWWHASNPNWRNMPIIMANVVVATAGAIIPIVVNGELMTYVLKRSATGEVAIFGGDFAASDGSKRGRHIFPNLAEYNASKVVFDTVNAHTGGAPTLPVVTSVVGVDETGWRMACNAAGV